MPKPTKLRSLATRFCVFTALLLIWIIAVQLLLHLRHTEYFVGGYVIGSLVLLVFSVSLARFTIGVFVRPLEALKNAMASVGEGRLEQIQVSRTGDEIEQLGDSFNRMIADLTASRQQVRDYQERLEQKIRERTDALEEAMRRLEAASRAKSEFLANMSHELRTPMNGILGMLDIVLDGDMKANQRDELLTAKECSISLLSLLNEILDLSKIEAGKLYLEQVAFEPRAVIDACVKSVLPKARQKGLELVCEVDTAVPRQVTGDPLRLRQILVNLVGNAIKFTEDGYVRLSVRRAVGELDGRVSLCVDVADTGIGIPQDKLSSIFEEFTQADGSTTRKYGGTGLGLAITRRLVELHNGRIWVESEAGRGSVFHAILELKPADAQVGLGNCAGSPEEAAGRAAGRILVVEDNIVNQKVLAKLLEKRGYQTTAAGHGREALEALEQGFFDLVLMDLQMPVMDGLEATRLIRRNARWDNLPIIGLTAHAMRGDRERCIDTGMNDYIPKPVQPPVLLAAIRKHLMPRAQEMPAGAEIRT